MSPKLASIVLGIVPPVAIAVIMYGRYLRNITKRTQDSLAESTQVRWTSEYNLMNALNCVLTL